MSAKKKFYIFMKKKDCDQEKPFYISDFLHILYIPLFPKIVWRHGKRSYENNDLSDSKNQNDEGKRKKNLYDEIDDHDEFHLSLMNLSISEQK